MRGVPIIYSSQNCKKELDNFNSILEKYPCSKRIMKLNEDETNLISFESIDEKIFKNELEFNNLETFKNNFSNKPNLIDLFKEDKINNIFENNSKINKNYFTNFIIDKEEQVNNEILFEDLLETEFNFNDLNELD
jgi:hypothetical protein